MIDYQDFIHRLNQTVLAPWSDTIRQTIDRILTETPHGDNAERLDALTLLPPLKSASIELNADTVRAGLPEEADEPLRQQLTAQLLRLHPWRKGPFEIAGVKIDTEWRSDWKWNRLKNHLAPPAGRLVLDIGCGSGYHCWRMAGAGAAMTVGIEPCQLYVMQYWAMRKYLGTNNCWVIPLALEDLPDGLTGFDTVLSMGVLYHRRSPMEHLQQLRDLLRPGGELVLETLVVEGDADTVLVPEGRYAKMRNVWFIPSVAAVELWLRKCGFTKVRTVDVTATTAEEQHSTPWMRWESLPDFLAPDNPRLTSEGHPAPIRAIILAEA